MDMGRVCSRRQSEVRLSPGRLFQRDLLSDQWMIYNADPFLSSLMSFCNGVVSPNDRLKCRPRTAAAQRLEPVKESSQQSNLNFPIEGCRASFCCSLNRGMHAEESSDTFILYDFPTAKLCSVNIYGGSCFSGPCDL